MASTKEDNSPNNSDSDDWTLVSPPHSSSSSPARGDGLITLENSPSPSDKSSSNSSLERIDEDGLTEIDLSGAASRKLRKHNVIFAAPTAKLDAEQSGGAEHSGFQPLDTTTDDEEDDEEDDEKNSRRSSLTQSELGEYVDLGKKDNSRTNGDDDLDDVADNQKSNLTLATTQLNGAENQQIVLDGRAAYQNACLLSLKSKLDELSDAATRLQTTRRYTNKQPLSRTSSPASISLSSVWRVPIKQWILLHLVLMTVHILTNYILHTYVVTPRQQQHNKHSLNNVKISETHNDNKPQQRQFSLENSVYHDLGKIFPASPQYVELQLLHSELNQCIKRQSPSSYKYYISEDRFKEQSTTQQQQTKNHHQKPYRGLVCYGQETQWRKRFEKLKSKYNLDLRKLMLDSRRRVANELLEFHNPSLQFKLILNQIEYLDFIENKRKEKQSEDLVKYLKAENLQLLRRLNNPNDTGIQKLIVSLELKNSRLERENEVLKQNLGQKAGPTYIKQSLELEQYERENTILKQFHYQVSQDISKSLKQFNLHTIDASTILDDQESLNSQLMLTRGYLRRLREKISTILIENEGLKEELKEIYLMSVTNKANLPATHNGRHGPSYNTNTALLMDNCTRSLVEFKEKNDRLEEELETLRRNCSGRNSFSLERCSLNRHLNRTGEPVYQSTECLNGRSSLDLKQLGGQTALGKHLNDALALQRRHSAAATAAADSDDRHIVDELMVLLTRFNKQVESTGFDIFDPGFSAQKKNTAGYLGGGDTSTAGEVKIIPNYIREAIRSDKSGNNNNNNKLAQYQMKLLPPTPPPMYTSNSSGSATSATVENNNNKQFLNEAQQTNATTKAENSVESSIDMYQTLLRRAWIFSSLGQQRKQLRNPQVDWMMKRAKLREKLREATSYVDGGGSLVDHEVKPKNKKKKNEITCSVGCTKRKTRKMKRNNKQQQQQPTRPRSRNGKSRPSSLMKAKAKKHFRDEL